MIMDAETYEEYKDELERPHAPRGYLDKVLVGRVHSVSRDGKSVTVFFWERENPGVSDGHPDGYLGDAWINVEAGSGRKVGDKILGKVGPAITDDALHAGA